MYLRLLLVCSISAGLASEVDDSGTGVTYQPSGTKEYIEEGDVVDERPWIGRILPRGLEDFRPSGLRPQDQCSIDGKLYFQALQTLQSWALKMYESSSRGLVTGLLEGKTYELGHFDECISAWSSKHEISGKYMVASLGLHPPYRIGPSESSRTERLVDRVNWALCVPSSCTDDEIAFSLNNQLRPILQKNHIQGNVTVLHRFSYHKSHRYTYPVATIMFLAVTFVLFAVVMASTFYDNNNNLDAWYVCFSIKRNVSRLMSTPKDELSAASGLKALLMLVLILLSHRFWFMLTQPPFNDIPIQDLLKHPISMYIFLLDVFITISGFILFNQQMRDLENNKVLGVTRRIYNRFMRFSPLYIFVLFMQFIVFSEIENGPLLLEGYVRGKTMNGSWWTHLFYLNNYILPQHQHLIVSWYLAFDMQVHVIAFLLMPIIFRIQRKHILPALCLFAGLSFLPPVVSIVLYNRPSVYIFNSSNPIDTFSSPQFQQVYLPTHMRATPFFVGMIGGYFFYQLKKSKIVFSKETVKRWSLVSLAAIEMVHLFTWLTSDQFVVWKHLLHSLFLRSAIPIAISWVIIATDLGQYSPLKKFFGLKIFCVMSKLSLGAMLLHSFFQVYSVNYSRSLANFTLINTIWLWFGDVFFTYLFSFLLYLLIEAPFSQLQSKIWNYLVLLFKSKHKES